MVSLSLDAWMSSNGFAFLAIVMHYVNADWELGVWQLHSSICVLILMLPFIEEILIDFCELISDHLGENLATAVWDILDLYGLKG